MIGKPIIQPVVRINNLFIHFTIPFEQLSKPFERLIKPFK